MSAAAAAPPGATGRARLGADACLMAASLSAGLGTARLTQSPGSAHVLVPIVATVVAGHLAASLARRVRVSIPATAASGVVAVALATVWGQFLSATRSGIPTSSTWRALVDRFDAAGAVIRSHPTPVPATTGVVLCIATGAGLVAVLGRTVWAWAETRTARPLATLAALVPTFGLFCYTALLSSQVDRVPGLVAYLACALVFVAVADQPAPGAGGGSATRVGAVRRAAPLLAVLPAVLIAATAVAVPLAVSPAFSALKVNALPFGSAPGAPGAGGPGPGGTGAGGAAPLGGRSGFDTGGTGVRAIDLVDDIGAVLTNRTGDVMFQATTPDATYWQVAVLTNFDGTAWVPDPTTQAAALAIAQPTQSRAVPGLPVLPEPAPVTTFRVDVTMGDLQSTLLPLPPTTVSVDANAEVVPGFGAIEAIEAPPGQRYSAVARVPAGRTAARARTAGAAAPAGTPGTAGPVTAQVVAPSSLTPYLAMPAIAPRVVALAHQIVRGAATPAAQAAALARWFDSGRFRYTLSPPVVAGADPLSAFLFTTRAGFCQQFAAAYAVLARIDGLPTRVAVGFTTGTALGRGRYQVTGADAHVWPEVYLGPATGWASYEPTPASSGEPTGVGVNSGSRGATQNGGPRTTSAPTSTVASLHRSFASPVSAPSTVPLVAHGGRGAAGRGGGGAGGVGVWVWALVVAGLALVALALRATLGRPHRRRGSLWAGVLRRHVERWRDGRRRRRSAADPTAEVLAQWRRAVSALDRARLGRRPAETVQEHAARLQSLAGAKWLATYSPVPVAPRGGPDQVPPANAVEAAVDAYAALAALADRAAYGPGPCTADEALGAEQLSALVRSGLVRSGLDSGRARAADPVPV